MDGWPKRMGERGSFVVWFGEVGPPSPSQVRVGERAWARGKSEKVQAPFISDVCNDLEIYTPIPFIDIK